MDTSTLTFLFTKVLAFVFNPNALFIAGLMLSFLLLMTGRWFRKGRFLLGLVLFGYVAFGMFPIASMAVNVLEDRFPTVRDYATPVAGIVVLAGAVDTVMTRERGQVSVSNRVERLSEFLRLSRQHPEAKLVFVGGQGRVFGRAPSEAEVAEQFLREAGMDTSKIWFEDASRNTEEGALASYHTLQPGNEPWVLITSARHMPRAVGLFRKAGWTVAAHPVDYHTFPGRGSDWVPHWPGGLNTLHEAMYEWGGLLFAWVRGKIDEPFPGPFPKPAPMAQLTNSDSL